MENNEQVVFKCTLASTDSSVPLGIRISLDTQTIYENLHVKNNEQVECKLSDNDGEHELVFDLFGKLPEHTKLDADGNIISDALLIIDNFNVDNINITQVVQTLASYTHDYNGSQQLIEDKFHGSMGCNGTVKLKFTTPVYLWLLENM